MSPRLRISLYVLAMIALFLLTAAPRYKGG